MPALDHLVEFRDLSVLQGKNQIMTEHEALPVHGYTNQSDEKVSLVNQNKSFEEVALRQLDLLASRDDVDKRWLAIGRTHMEQAWMAINRSIFQPKRVKG
jgi:hypothetical protein